MSTRQERQLLYWNIGFAVVFGLWGMLGAWWTILIQRLVAENYALKVQVLGKSAELIENHQRQVWMMLGESTTLLALSVSLVGFAFSQARRERVQIRRLEGMLAASTHELKTPVAAVRGLLESMQSGVLPPEKATPYLGRGLEAVSRLEHLIEGILAYQASVARPIPLQLRSLGGWILPIVEHRRSTETGEQIAVSLGEAAELEVIAAEDPLRVILENLLDNARKYGGKEVRVEALAVENGVELKVLDKGSGFEPESAERLFEPYERGSAGQKRHGTGLGLYLARQLARSMGGELRASSDGPGKGACFTLSLKRA
jgi:signal transduction histidine kinase